MGAGALGVVALLALYPLDDSPGDRLVATDIAHALPVTVEDMTAGHTVAEAC